MQSLEVAQPSNGDSASKQVTFCASCDQGSFARVALNVEADGVQTLLSLRLERQAMLRAPWRMTALPYPECLSHIAQVWLQPGENGNHHFKLWVSSCFAVRLIPLF
jgi:hypothetical protein